jgi:hypothetical protein
MAALSLHEDGTEDDEMLIQCHCLGLLYLCPQMRRTFKGYAIMTMVVVIETVSGDPIRSKSVSKDPPRW